MLIDCLQVQIDWNGGFSVKRSLHIPNTTFHSTPNWQYFTLNEIDLPSLLVLASVGNMHIDLIAQAQARKQITLTHLLTHIESRVLQ